MPAKSSFLAGRMSWQSGTEGYVAVFPPMRFLLAFGLILTLPAIRAAEADVIVYGATPGGFCAAIAAAREGAKVALIEPTAHVGGVNTGGLSFSDSNQTIRATLLGLFEEWHKRVAADYAARGVKLPYDVAVKNNVVWTYEPHVAARVTAAMLKEAGVTVLTQQPLESVEKDGAKADELPVRPAESIRPRSSSMRPTKAT
jgi:NADPH-dependent 2,4-dienoyl-CoA reductase/sulfur reductase-like enzyme